MQTCTFESDSFSKEAYSFQGSHFLVNYVDCDYESLVNIEALRNALLTACKQSGASVLKYIDHIFPGNGFTMTVLLSESHASIHTYPEHRACFIDLFTCGNRCSHVAFAETMQAYLQAGFACEKLLIRNENIEDKG